MILKENAVSLYDKYKKTKDKKFLEEAINILEGKDDISSLNLLGLILLELDKLEEAENAIDKGLRKAKSDEDKGTLLFNKSLIAYRKGDYRRAYELLKSIPTKSSTYPHARRFLAKVCLSLGEVRFVEEARGILESYDIPNEDLATCYIFLSRNGKKELYKKR
ncbi:tetratricopeptide repeat protein [Acidianus sp. RZ1]|uniref:tetratricopeptide repeat protein n=1 Tax=Acidianus sp. RZ1 TaxID=1540082 RepID=UPI0020A5B834|nr:tetratricopeptide repeat protein [Acidianus sp. RZ1]